MFRPDMTSAPMITCAGCKHSYADSALFCPNCGTPKARNVAATADPLVGKVLGERFQILELLGHGGSGTIYRAEHVTLRRKVAIKVLHNELSRDDLAVERFRREATTVAEIDNEHIVEIHDFGRTHDGRLYLAMELLEGETLDHVLEREKTLSVERTADILIQVGEALMEAHAIGYVHRDLRPRNVYLAVRRGKANFVKLLDFGLAKLVETDAQAASTSLGMTFGDPRYMSPEQARGDRIDRRADIYQLGCVAYEMLTGQPPFTGNRVFDILSKQVTEIPAPLPTRRPGVPLWVEAAVAKMLAKDPENRFATTTRLVEALRLGLETGQIMEDEIARRRESIPPPSVSRVMQKMGLSAPIDPVPGPLVSANQTLKGQLDPSAPHALAASVDEPRRRTGTPNLGVPVQPAVAGQIEPRAPQPAPQMPSQGVYVAPPSGPAIAVPGSQTVHGYGASIDNTPMTPSAAAPVPSSTVAGYAAAQFGPPAMPPPAGAPATPAVSPSTLAQGLAGNHNPALSPTAPAPSIPVTPVVAAAPVAPAPVTPSAPVPAAPIVPSSSGSVEALPSGRSKRSSSQLGPGDSAAWFDEGDNASAEADKIRARKQISTSTTDLSLYDDLPAQRRRWPLVVGVLGTLALVGGIAFALTRGDDKPSAKKDAPVATAPTPAPTDVPPSQIITPDGSGSAAAPTPPTPANVTTPGKTGAKDGGTKRPSGGGGGSVTKTTNPDDTASRRPGGGGAADWFGGGTTTTPTTTPDPVPVTTTPTPTPTPTNNGGSVNGGGPSDPYADVETPPADNAAPEKKGEFFSNLGKTQLASGDMAGAAASFKKALELDAKNIPAIIGMGEIALRQGLFGDAIAHLKKAAKLAPKSAHVLTLLGEAYLGTGNSAVAAETFKKALQLDPDNTRAREGFNEAQSRVPPAEDD